MPGEGNEPTGSEPRYYFAYGSNMNRLQMARRFKKPISEINFHSRVHLPTWKFIICGGGYASIDRCSSADLEMGNDRVWGALYIIEASDEAILDGYEGVDIHLYTKEYMDLFVCPPGKERVPPVKLEKIKGLVYVATRNDKGLINDEYIPRMEDAVNDPDTALPKEYVEKWMRPELDPHRDAPRGISVKDLRATKAS